jgi:hypothetical protein
MSKPDQICPIAPAPASKTTSTRAHRRPIPDDLLRDASRRLGIMSLVAGGLWIVASVLAHYTVRWVTLADPQWYRLDGGDAIAAVCVVVSLLLFTYTRQEGRNPRRIMDLGLAYMLTGRQVFEGDTVMQVMGKHLQAAPVPPSQRVPFTISPGLEAVVLACLAKKPEDRPQSAVEMAGRLAAIDVEPWTDVQAKAWWTARDVSDAQGNGAASLPPPSSGSDETRLESPDANGRTILIDK